MGRRLHPRVTAAAAVFVLLAGGPAAWTPTRVVAQAAGVTGTWNFDNETDKGKTNAIVVLKQEGDTLSGLYSSSVMADASLTGTVKGQDIEFWFTADVRGRSVEMYFAGKVEGPDAMEGTVDLAVLGAGTFVARRQK